MEEAAQPAEAAAEHRAPLLLPGVLGVGDRSRCAVAEAEPMVTAQLSVQTQVRRCTSDVTEMGQAVARVRANSVSSDSRMGRAASSRNLVVEDEMQVEQMVEELDRFMDSMREEPDTLRSIVSRWPQAWDRDELKDLRRHRNTGLHAFEGPVGYKQQVPTKKKASLKDTIFTPLGLMEMGSFTQFGGDCDKTSPTSSPSRQARFLRDEFFLGKQVLTDFTLIHLATYSHDPVKHICTLLEANADVNTPATYQATFQEGSDSPVQNSPKSPAVTDPVVVKVTALHLAVYMSKVEVVRLLLDVKASPDSRAVFDTVPDYTALHLAAAIAQQKADQAVHEAAEVHLNQRKALQAAKATEDAQKVIRLLLQANADVKAADLSGRSCLRMLFDLHQPHLEKWTAGMSSADSTRLQTALSAGSHHFSEMELESSIFKGLIVRLPDQGELGNDDVALLAGESAQLHGGQVTPLTARDITRLFRKDFRVVDVHHKDGGSVFVDCMLMTTRDSGARTRTSAEMGVFRFPRYITTSRRRTRSDWLSSGNEARPSFDVVSHTSSNGGAMARFGQRKAWMRLGVVVQGYEYFDQMVDHLRSHVYHNHAKAESTPIRRFSTSPNFGVSQTILEDEEPDGGAMSLPLPPRPATTTGAFSKAKTVTVLDFSDENPFGLMDSSAHVDMVLDTPLPPGARYKKSWVVRKACLLHYAVQVVIKSEEERAADGSFKVRQQALDDLQLVLDAKADVLARAYYRGRAGAFCTTTALHMVTAAGCCIAAAMLLKARASIEVTSTMNGMPYYHPLHNAAYCGSSRLCRLLLKERANPNTTNNEGRTGLHLAVKQNHIEIVRILVEAKGNVVARDRCWVGGLRCKTVGLTPLDMCRRATRQYSEGERAEIMALLSPSFNGVNSFLFDLHNMAISSDAAIGGFLVDQALKLKTAEVMRAVSQLKAHAVQGQVTGCRIGFEDDEMTPIDYMASIILNAPRVGVRVLNSILLDDPATEDNVRGALPARANLKPRHQDSWFPWRRNGWFISPFLCNYKSDNNSDRHDQETVPAGREHWPCWLHREDEPDPPWHRDLAPTPGHMGLRAAGDFDVQVKVLLLANAIDVRILRAFARVNTSDIFAELIVQAIIGCTFDQVANAVTLLVALEEATLFMMFMRWSKVDEQHWRWGSACWSLTSAIAIKEVLVHCYGFVQHLKMGWPGHEFLLTNTWSHTFKVIRLICLIMLVLETRLTYLLDKTGHPAEEVLLSEVVEETTPRKLLGTNIVIQGLQIVLLLRNASPEAEFGRHILSIIHSFGRLWAILVVMVCFFFSFSFAFFVMDEDLSWMQLMEKVYRGLLLADGDGIDFMEGKYSKGEPREGHRIEWFLSCLATFLFTICLLNISIAVFQTEYEKALKESYLHFWQHRAFLCMQTLLGPRWPWGLSELGPRATSLVVLVQTLRQRAVRITRRARRRLRRTSVGEDEGEPMLPANMEDPDAVQIIHLAGIFCAVFFGIAAVAVFFVPVHHICCAVCLSISLCVLQALAVRTEAMSAHRCGKKFFLWICHRADFSPSFYIDEDVEKDDIRALRSSVEDGIAELKRGIANLTALDLGRRMEKLEGHVVDLDRRLLNVASAASASASASPASGPLAAAAAEVREVRQEMEATLGQEGTSTNPWQQDSVESLEWAAQHHSR